MFDYNFIVSAAGLLVTVGSTLGIIAIVTRK